MLKPNEDQSMTAFEISFLFSVFLCALTTGLVYTFAVVVMPGIRTLSDRDFLRAFRVMDRVIQQNDPRFLTVWIGSVLSLMIACGLGFGALDGINRLMLVAVTLLYLLGVQAPTIAINIPMNNRLQTLTIEQMTSAELGAERDVFESRWNYWNSFRTVIACVSTFMLILLGIRL
jgi:uncharacterized membrane protein